MNATRFEGITPVHYTLVHRYPKVVDLTNASCWPPNECRRHSSSVWSRLKDEWRAGDQGCRLSSALILMWRHQALPRISRNLNLLSGAGHFRGDFHQNYVSDWNNLLMSIIRWYNRIHLGEKNMPLAMTFKFVKAWLFFCEQFACDSL